MDKIIVVFSTREIKPQTPREAQTPNGVRGDRRSRSTKDSGVVAGGVVGVRIYDLIRVVEDMMCV